MNSSDFRRLAREKLSGRWGKAALMVLVFSLCSLLVSIVCNMIPLIGSIALMIISPVLQFGFVKEFIMFKNNEKFAYTDFFKLGFENFGKFWNVTLRTFLKIVIPLVLFLISYILLIIVSPAFESFLFIGVAIILCIASLVWYCILFYKYMFVGIELAYSPDKDAKEIVETSGNYMIGKRLNAFVLKLSFIGWSILSCMLLCIPLFWLIPYMQIADIIFYEWASGRLNDEKEEIGENSNAIIKTKNDADDSPIK